MPDTVPAFRLPGGWGKQEISSFQSFLGRNFYSQPKKIKAHSKDLIHSLTLASKIQMTSLSKSTCHMHLHLDRERREHHHPSSFVITHHLNSFVEDRNNKIDKNS